MRVAMAVLLAGMVLLVGAPAHAEPRVGSGTRAGGTAFTELQIQPITGDLGLTNVAGYDVPGLDPESGYPTTTPPAGSTPHTIAYAGAIPARDPSGTTVLTYCIDLFTDTQSGVTYERGEWSEANVPNLDRVHYILQNYYPNNPNQPAGVADNVKAAAVQAAIWFFTDNYVVDTNASNNLYALTSAIVADALASEPVPEPEPINLTIEPEEAAAPLTGELVGPFTVSTNGPATLRLTPGVEVYADAAGTQRRAEGDTVADGDQLFVRATSTTAAQQGFSLERLETIQESTVYLFDGSDPARETAQKLVLAQSRDLQARGSVLITPYTAGGIAVTKTITGTGAGLQDDVVVAIACTPPDGGDPIQREVTIPAGTTGEFAPDPITGLPVDTTCTVTEVENGDNERVDVTATSITPGPEITIVEGENTPVTVTNTYAISGGIAVTKRITGSGAGLQGEVVVAIACTPPEGGDPIEREVTIPAGTTGEVAPTPITGLRAGSTCTVTEPENGENGLVNPPVITLPENVTILENATVPVTVTNDYERAVGALSLAKVITGTGAGLQGEVVIAIACTPPEGGDPIQREVTIPAGSTGETEPQTVSGLPAGATCAVTEPENGDNGLVNPPVTTLPENVRIIKNAGAFLTVTNEYTRASGGLRLTKVIAGPPAGRQGEVVIALDCDDPENAFDQQFTVPAGSPAGAYPQEAVTGIPAGTECSVTETATGATGAVQLDSQVITPTSIDIVDAEITEVTVTNTYREEGKGGGGGSGGGNEVTIFSPGGGNLPSTGAAAQAVLLAALGAGLALCGAVTLIIARRQAASCSRA